MSFTPFTRYRILSILRQPEALKHIVVPFAWVIPVSDDVPGVPFCIILNAFVVAAHRYHRRACKNALQSILHLYQFEFIGELYHIVTRNATDLSSLFFVFLFRCLAFSPTDFPEFFPNCHQPRNVIYITTKIRPPRKAEGAAISLIQDMGNQGGAGGNYSFTPNLCVFCMVIIDIYTVWYSTS